MSSLVLGSCFSAAVLCGHGSVCVIFYCVYFCLNGGVLSQFCAAEAAPPAQTHTGDYNDAGYPFHCQPIGGEEGSDLAITPEGALTSKDAELEVRCLLLRPSRSCLSLRTARV